MVLTHCLLLFLLALQAQDAQTAPVRGQGADVARGRALPAPQMVPMLIPSWYPRVSLYKVKTRKDFQRTPEVPKEALKNLEKATSEMETEQKETLQMPVSGREAIQGANTPAQPQGPPGGPGAGEKAGHGELSKFYILGTAAALGVLLLGIVVLGIVLSLLSRRDTTQRTREAPGQANTESSSPSPVVFAAQLAQMSRHMVTGPSPLPTCPSCSLADCASSCDNWILLDSSQPTPFGYRCYQCQGYCTLKEDCFVNG
ncbi:PREDICTED: uncharacterized protein LOC108494736 isoform X2 [Lepidothrix coronata]|uniref:Uncharacterized protein LOC108494736 isoform X2 n=1 Tax=Lepidothrix coronata TaxID=321398 RepID=A0A6J0GT68_9PASS|nr:PREDICTED: uncharacterized protein LOC108494736 isoform X2 [Lepidothrix coronata]